MKTKEVAWDEELASWQKSGLSQAEYCRRRNVSPKGFAYRLMKSRAEPSTHRRSYQSSGNGSKRMRRLGKRNAGFIEKPRWLTPLVQGSPRSSNHIHLQRASLAAGDLHLSASRHAYRLYFH